MDIKDEKAAPGGTGAAGEDIQRRADISTCLTCQDAPSPKKPKPESKRAAMIRAFLEVGPNGMNCFAAANRFHDFVLRTTVSELSRDCGLSFNKKFETVPGHAGSSVTCVRYALKPDSYALARELVGLDERAAA